MVASMFSALAGGRVEDVRHLLEGGAEINETDRDGRTPLFVASREDHPAVAETRSLSPLLEGKLGKLICKCRGNSASSAKHGRRFDTARRVI